MSDHPSARHPIDKTATEARQGATPGIVRWILGVSLAGAIVAMGVAYLLVHGV